MRKREECGVLFSIHQRQGRRKKANGEDMFLHHITIEEEIKTKIKDR